MACAEKNVGLQQVNGKDKEKNAQCKYVYHGWIHPVTLDVTKDDTISNAKEYVTNLQHILTNLSAPPQSETEAAITEKIENGMKTQNYPFVGLVNNAGIAYISPIELVNLEKVQYNLDVNVLGVLRCSKAFIPLLRASKGRVINVGSVAGKIVPPLYGIYSASKYALEAITDALRMELRPFEMAAILLQPGTVQSNIRQTTMAHYTFLNDGKDPGAQERITQEDKTNTNSKDDDQKITLYGSFAEQMDSKCEILSQHAAPASVVSDKLFHALHSRNPRSRYMMGYLEGTSVHISPIIRILNTILPDYAQDIMKLNKK